MVSLASLKWPSADKIPAKSDALRFLWHNFSGLFRSDSGNSNSLIIYSTAAITLPAACLFLYSNRNKNKTRNKETHTLEVVNLEKEVVNLEKEGDHSLVNLEKEGDDSLVNVEKEGDYSLCEICLENKETWQMFTNDTCDHSFCYECTTTHIVVKIKDRVEDIVCPWLNCNAILNFEACRLLVPIDTLIQWDELLCLSLIPDSQKLYCPFLDCSAMLVNDSGEALTKINCLVCKRCFCGKCLVPWHSNFTCNEFMKLNPKKGGNEDEIVKTLAKKKNWKKCPKCKMYVEKREGCDHITCRCKYEFCYICGEKWSSNTHQKCWSTYLN